MSRLIAAVHHVIASSCPSQLGLTRLNSILWYSDLEHYRWHGISITALTQYTRTCHGPMAKEILLAIRQLARNGKIIERDVQCEGYKRREMISVEQPDISALTAEQISILGDTLTAILPLKASHFLHRIHRDRLWLELTNDQAMLVATGSVINQRLARADHGAAHGAEHDALQQPISVREDAANAAGSQPSENGSEHGRRIPARVAKIIALDSRRAAALIAPPRTQIMDARRRTYGRSSSSLIRRG